jgi:hypothetical protein
MNKNWLVDPHIGCLKLANFSFVSKAKFNLIEELYVEFVTEVEHEEFLNVHNTFYGKV